jgi:hypothetical protein
MIRSSIYQSVYHNQYYNSRDEWQEQLYLLSGLPNELKESSLRQSTSLLAEYAFRFGDTLLVFL